MARPWRALLLVAFFVACVSHGWAPVRAKVASGTHHGHSQLRPRALAVPPGGEQTPLNSCATEHKDVICNYQDVYTCSVGQVVQPSTVADVVAAVRAAGAAGHTVRAVGHAHSDNDVFCAPDSVTLLMGGLDAISAIDEANMTGVLG